MKEWKKSIIYQRGLLHNFNSIKNSQHNKIKQYEKSKSNFSKMEKYLLEENDKLNKRDMFNKILLVVFVIILSSSSIINVILNTIYLLSIFFSGSIIFNSNENLI